MNSNGFKSEKHQQILEKRIIEMSHFKWPIRASKFNDFSNRSKKLV